MFVVDNTVSRIMLQFSFSNGAFVPKSIVSLPAETPDDHIVRNAFQGSRSGIMVIEPTEKCSLVEFLSDLEDVGFELVGATHQERLDKKDVRRKRTYHMVRFVFARIVDTEISGEPKTSQEAIRADLQKMCEGAMSRVRVFSNPVFRNGEKIQGERVLSVNLEARVPLFLPNNQPVVVWQKDDNGKRVGDAPVPIAPEFILRIIEGTIQLVEN